MIKNKKILIVSVIILLIIIGIVCVFTFMGKEKTTYVITFNSQGGTSVPDQVIEEGTCATMPINPTKEGYIFIEWLQGGISYDFNSVVDKNITLTASWKTDIPEKEFVTVKFITDGGTPISSSVIEKGEKVSIPESPSKEGFVFVEWQLDGNKYDFDTKVTENIELTAKWEKETVPEEKDTRENDSESVTPTPTPTQNKYSVTFNSNGGSSVSSQTVVEGKKVRKPTNPTRSGYTFVEWQLDGATYNFNSNVTKNITLTASWKKITTYTVSFNSNGGSTVSSQTVYEGQKVTKPANPTRSGYTFVEWQLDGTTYNFNASVTKNITLKAIWKALSTYTVSFNSNGGSAVSSQNVQEGSKAKKPSNPTREGYTFSAWQLNGKNYDFNSNVSGNITLTAKWTQKTYIVKVSNVDQYSPDRILTVYENGSKINVSSIKYTNGTTLCSGSNMVVNMYEIEGISKLTIILKGGTSVTASVQ